MNSIKVLVCMLGVSLGLMAQPVKSIVGARGIGATETGWTNPYVTDGLVAMWDGEWNAGGGVHDASATTWVDLIGERVAVLNGCSFADKYLAIGNHNAEWTGTLFVSNIDITIEMVFETDFMNCGNWATPLTTTDDAFSFFRRNGEYWESKMPFTSMRPYLKPFKGKPFYNKLTSRNFVSAYCDGSGKDTQTGIAAITETTKTWQIGGNQNRYLGDNAKYYCLRIYYRALTDEEIAHNYAIDKERFNLP